MGLFIRSLLIVMIVKSQAGVQVGPSGDPTAVSCGKDRMVDKLKVMLTNYLEMVNTEVSNTKHLVEDLKGVMTYTQETVFSELADTRRQVYDLQILVSGNQEKISAELGDTRRKTDELQAAFSDDQETVSSELEDTGRKVDELQVSVSALVNLLDDTPPKDTPSDAIVTTTEGVTFPKDCSDVLAIGVLMSGVYMVQPRDSSEAFQVYCDMDTDGGGWTVFQRRQDGSVDFYLDFSDYSRGFGNLEGEFWLGNDNLHRLTAQGEYELRVDLAGFDDETGYALYDSFSISNASDKYRLKVGEHSGTAVDGLSSHNYQAFSTKDQDNDVNAIGSCAIDYHGAWWYRFCYSSSLNGIYYQSASLKGTGIIWDSFSNYRSLKFTEMKIRSKV